MQTCVQLGNLFKPTVTLNSHQFWRIGLTCEKRKDPFLNISDAPLKFENRPWVPK